MRKQLFTLRRIRVRIQLPKKIMRINSDPDSSQPFFSRTSFQSLPLVPFHHFVKRPQKGQEDGLGEGWGFESNISSSLLIRTFQNKTFCYVTNASLSRSLSLRTQWRGSTIQDSKAEDLIASLCKRLINCSELPHPTHFRMLLHYCKQKVRFFHA
jgi:hypothetical protein